ncbi:MAG: hypothetical protein LUH47_02165, partial [Clostridiales bacterium]|nr:hypothetical protein [Clostridiales bacterium]
YNPDNLSEAVFSGNVAATADRDTTLKQIKFMRTASGTLYFDNIVFAGESDEESTESTTETTTETSSEEESEETTESDALSGDVDGNGYLTANDAAVALYYVLNNEAELNPNWDLSLGTADMDGSGVVEANDAAIILRKVLDSAYQYTAE